MAEQHQKTIVGVFALAALVLMSVLVLLFGGGRTLFAGTYAINVHFKEGAVGLQEGQSVTLSGKRVGETRGVDFIDPQNLQEGINLVVAVDDDFDLPERCHVEVSSNVMSIGRPVVRIVVDDPKPDRLPRDGSAVIPGRMVPVTDQIVPPEMQNSLQRAVDEVGRLAATMQPVMANLEKLLAPRGVKEVDLEGVAANLATLVQRADEVLKHVASIVGDEQNRENFRQVLANARTMSERGVEAIEQVRQFSDKGGRLADDAGRLVREMYDAVNALSVLLTHANDAAAALNGTDGTAGAFLNDKRLYEELVLSAKRMAKMLDEMREVLAKINSGEIKFGL